MPGPLSQGDLVTDLGDRQLSRAEPLLPNAWLQPSRRKYSPQELGKQETPSLFSVLLLWAQRALFLSLFSLDKVSRASLSQGLLQLLNLHEKRGILDISPSPLSQILPQNCCFPKTCPTGATIPKTRHVVGETANFLLKWTPTQLEKMPPTNPCTTQHQSQPCSKPGAELGHLLCPFQPLIFQDFFHNYLASPQPSGS